MSKEATLTKRDRELAALQRPPALHEKNAVTQEQLQRLGAVAWEHRERAVIFGKTKVGAAALAEDGSIFGGCNIEHRLRSHDIHAERCAIGIMITSGKKQLRAIVIAAERTEFTPCGSCCDWIMELGGSDCVVGFQPAIGTKVAAWRMSELMPHYPH